MESEVIKRFNSELSSIHESKAPSKSKIQDITRAALKAKSLYKHVVFSIEKFLSKCKPEHRLHVLYIIDSIIRASKHQFKEKDVFAQRFLSNFDKIFNALLNCKKNEQLKIVRTINLWQANGVYTKEEMEPTLNLCRQAGLETDVEAVEKAVKGSAADMRIYGGSYIKKNKKHHVQKSTTPPMPPPPLSADGLLGAQPMEPPFVPSEEIVDGVISEKEMLDLIESSGCDTTGMFSKDSDLLRKAHSIFVSSLKPRVLEHNTNSLRSNPDNIKNVLTKDFDYSDDEDEKDEEKRVPKEPEPEQLTHEEIFGMAAEMMKNQNVVNALTTMIHERVASINAAANAALQHNNSSHGVGINQENSNQQNFGALHGVNINQQMLQNAQIQAALQQQGRLPPGIAQNAALAQLQALQNVSQPQSNLLGLMGNPMLNLVPGGLGLQGLAQNNGPVTSTASGIEISSQLNMTPMGVPPPNMHDANDLHAAAQQQIRLLENEASRNETDSAAPSRRRSRSRERVGRNGTKERDRSRDRERRKMGLPPIKPGVTFIASRTLWFKKVPANCSESDLKAAVLSTGDVARVKVIGNRACAYVTMETRKAASDVVNKLREVTVARKTVKVYWARAEFMNDSEFSEMWDMDRGVLAVPYEKLPESLEKLCDGAMLDIESLPETKKGKYKVDGTVVDETPNETAVAPPYPYGMPPIPAPVPPPPGMGQHYAPPPMSMPPPKPPQGMLNLSLPPPGPPGAYRQQMMPPHMMQQPGVPAPGVPPPAFNMNQCGPPPAGNFNGPPPIHNQMMYQNSPRNGPPPPMRGGFRGGFRGRGGYDGGRGGYGGRGGFDGGHGGFRNDGRGRFEDRRFDDGWNRRGGRFEDRRGRWNNRRVSDSRETGIHDGATEPKRIHDDETVSSTTLDDVKPSVDVDNLKKDIEDSDLNGEVPMDLE